MKRQKGNNLSRFKITRKDSYCKAIVRLGDRYPRDPPVLKILRRVNFGIGSRFGTDAGKRYGEGSEMLVFLVKAGRKTVQIVRNYSGSKLPRIRAP